MKVARKWVTLSGYPQEHLAVIRDEKVSLPVKSEIILPLLCFLLDSFTNKRRRTMEFYDNFVERFQDISKVVESCCQKGKDLVFTLHLVDLVVLNVCFHLVPPFDFLK